VVCLANGLDLFLGDKFSAVEIIHHETHLDTANDKGGVLLESIHGQWRFFVDTSHGSMCTGENRDSHGHWIHAVHQPKFCSVVLNELVGVDRPGNQGEGHSRGEDPVLQQVLGGSRANEWKEGIAEHGHNATSLVEAL